MQIHNLFPTHVWYDNLPVSEPDRFEAIEYCRDIQRENPAGEKFSNKGGWQSQSLYYGDLYDTPINVYLKQIEVRVDKIYYDLGSPRMPEMANAWININGKDHLNSSHNHPAGTLSGCFYLTESNSEIVLQRPTDANTAMIYGLSSNGNTEISCLAKKFTPKKNDLIIFPSWLFHHVQPNLTTEERISIAFNINTGDFR